MVTFGVTTIRWPLTFRVGTQEWTVVLRTDLLMPDASGASVAGREKGGGGGGGLSRGSPKPLNPISRKPKPCTLNPKPDSLSPKPLRPRAGGCAARSAAPRASRAPRPGPQASGEGNCLGEPSSPWFFARKCGPYGYPLRDYVERTSFPHSLRRTSQSFSGSGFRLSCSHKAGLFLFLATRLADSKRRTAGHSNSYCSQKTETSLPLFSVPPHKSSPAHKGSPLG